MNKSNFKDQIANQARAGASSDELVMVIMWMGHNYYGHSRVNWHFVCGNWPKAHHLSPREEQQDGLVIKSGMETMTEDGWLIKHVDGWSISDAGLKNFNLPPLKWNQSNDKPTAEEDTAEKILEDNALYHRSQIGLVLKVMMENNKLKAEEQNLSESDQLLDLQNRVLNYAKELRGQ